MGFRRIVQKSLGGLIESGSVKTRARSDAMILIADVLKKDQTWIIAHPEYIPTTIEQEMIEDHFRRRSLGEPIAYVRGWTEWYGHRFVVSHDTLIPRPFSEHLVEIALEIATQHHIFQAIDVGTGSGCIALSLSQSGLFKHVLATDVSQKALTIARRNQLTFSEVQNIKFIEADLLPETIASPSIIVANLPYLPLGTYAEEKGFEATGEPTMALQGGPKGWELILRLIKDLDSRRWTGWLLLECETVAESAITASLSPAWNLHPSLGCGDGKASIIVLDRS